MSAPAAAPRSMVERKPPHGEPCTRCGLCCFITLCDLGREVFRREEGPCPALVFDQDGASSCRLIAEPTLRDRMRAAAAVVVGAGLGCDSRINGEPVNHAFELELALDDIARFDEINAARTLWGLPPKRGRT